MLGGNGHDDQDGDDTFSFMTDEGKTRLLSKFVDNDIAHTAVENDEALGEESVEVLPEEWNLEPDEILLVTQYLKKYFTSSAWLIVEKGLSSLKQQPKQDEEINALIQLTKLFPGVKKTKATVSDFVVVVAEVRLQVSIN